MSANLINNYVSTFSTNVDLLLQQKGSKLRNTVMNGSAVGKQASPVDQIGAIAATRVSSRFAPMPRIDAPTDRRWVFPADYDVPQLIDTLDMLRLIIDPKSAYTENATYALGRAMDDEIIAAFFGDAKTGETGATTTSFPAANQVAVDYGGASNTGLTIAKLREAKRLLMTNEVDVEADTLYVAITAQQHDDLLGEQQAISLDYNTRPVLVDGRITSFMGFNFVNTQRLGLNASTFRRVPAWAKSGMHLGTWQDIRHSVSTRHDLRNEPYQLYSVATIGATRLEEGKVVEIICAE